MLALVLVAGFGCGKDGADGTDGQDGEDGTSCTVADNGDGTRTITCGDGTVVIADGTDGQDGDSCTVVDNGDGSKTITCEDGTVVTVDDGHPGLNEGETYGLFVNLSVSAPANGTHFVAGEAIAIRIEMVDRFGDPVKLTDLSVANLYMNGPRAMLQTQTSVSLLAAGTNRSSNPHHYINLKTTTNSNLTTVGGALVYTTAAMGTEPAGTYTAGLWAVRADAPLDQVFEMIDVQLGTATVEPNIVGNCGNCHEGAANGVTYLHHADPGYSPWGNPSLDSDPVRTCKNCHNQEGYAAIQVCADGSKPVRDTSSPPKYLCEDGTENWTYVNDPIVRRVHGVHNGHNLLSNYNTNAEWGDFRHYTDVVFPANVENCTNCHLDDAWKKPSRQACTACHDNLDMASGDYLPPKAKAAPPRLTATACTANSNCTGVGNGVCDTVAGFCQVQACTQNNHCADTFSGFDGVCNTGTGLCELRDHFGGAAADDAQCSVCHGAGKMAAVDVVHSVTPPAFRYDLDITLTPAPANGQYYVAGEAPKVRLVVSESGVPIDHTTIRDTNIETNRAYLFINGPRARRIPALSTAARAQVQNGVNGPWNLTSTSLQLKFGNGSTMTLTPAPAAFANLAAATAAEVVAWLNGNATFSAAGFAYLSADGERVLIAARPSPVRKQIEVMAGTLATAMSWPVGVVDAKAQSSSYAANSFLQYADTSKIDPKASWTTGYVEYQLDDVGTVAPGTYTVFINFGRTGTGLTTTVDHVTFQVGTATEEYVATDCASCHGDERMHGSYPFNTDVCGSCHDYKRGAADRLLPSDPVDGWGINAASGRGNMGFGAGPISRRVHGVHFGHYVNKPREIHGSYDYSGVIFPQDVRNCTKCHSASQTWTEKPSRLACMACHDSDAAIAHGLLNTWDPTPVDAWNGDELESCQTCHGADREFAPEVVHNIWAPYAPPYARDPE